MKRRWCMARGYGGGIANLIGIEVELLLWNDPEKGDHLKREDRSIGI